MYSINNNMMRLCEVRACMRLYEVRACMSLCEVRGLYVRY